MAGKILLSVCIPTNNRSEFLLRNLEALRAEINSLPVEIVVCDDASTDKTPEVVRKFTSSEKNVKIIYRRFEKRIYFDRVVLKMVESATGKFCWLLGDDDLPKKGSIKTILKVIKKYPDLSLIHLNYSRFDNLVKKVTAPKMINGIANDIYFKDYGSFYFKPIKNSYFKFLGTHTITMSSNVINRSKWLSAAKSLKKFIGHNFIHSFVIGTIIKARNAVYFVCKPQVQYLSNNHRIWPNDIWKDYNNVLLGYLENIGFDGNKIKKVRDQQREYEKREAVTRNKFLVFIYNKLAPVYYKLFK